MGRPLVPIEVDDEAGGWAVGGMPVILAPRHFFANTRRAVEGKHGRGLVEITPVSNL